MNKMITIYMNDGSIRVIRPKSLEGSVLQLVEALTGSDIKKHYRTFSHFEVVG